MDVGLQCVGRGYRLLNHGQTFKIIGIIQEIMRIIVFVHLNRWIWLHKESFPGHPKALLPLLDTYQSSLGAYDENQRLPAPENWDVKA
jgi:hypothetical protein